ncbi:MAG: excinuclease ABC subunit UvrC [Anaerorhabdus sp.]
MSDLKLKLKMLPSEPGCYLMKDKKGNIIYIGKAKKLKSRVNQYFIGAHDFKTTKLVASIVDFDFIVTKTEKEALLLEINLIKKHRPRFNIMFMDDKSYPYIRLTKENYPRLEVVRETRKNKKSKYFGPFPDAAAAHQTLKLLQDLYPFRRCKILPKKFCLYYHLGQCLGPCELDIDQKIYQEYSQKVHQFFNGDTKMIVQDLKLRMDEAQEKMNYEMAIEYRDYISSINHTVGKQQVQFDDNHPIDVFSYYVDRGYLSIQGFFLRSGQLLEKKLSLSPVYGDVEEEFISFLSQYYQKNPIPYEVLLPKIDSLALLSELLEVKIHVPQKGKMKKLLDMAHDNAKRQLELKFDIVEAKQKTDESSMRELSDLAHTEINRIEVFDNSHTAGAFTVASCVVFDNGIPNKAAYRTYRLHTENSDVDSMKEVLYRRYFRLIKENQPLPDCIIVDGGLPQINAAKDILTQLSLPICLLGLVKNEKHQTSNLMNDQGEMIEIDRGSSLFFLLARMQDEAHRVAISYHRKLRKKAQTKSILDEVSGIGDKRKKKLLQHFGGLNKLKTVTLEELEEVVPTQVAQSILNLFKGYQD